MRTRLIYLLAFICLSFTSLSSHSMTTPSAITPVEILYEKIASMKVKDIQILIGRKLTIKERIGFWLLQQKIKHEQKKGLGPVTFLQLKQKIENGLNKEGPLKKKKRHAEASQGQTAFVIAIAAAALLVIGLFVPYVILGALVASIFAIVMGSVAYKQNRSDKKAHAAKLLGWITLGLIAFLFLLAVIVVATWAWY